MQLVILALCAYLLGGGAKGGNFLGLDGSSLGNILGAMANFNGAPPDESQLDEEIERTAAHIAGEGFEEVLKTVKAVSGIMSASAAAANSGDSGESDENRENCERENFNTPRESGESIALRLEPIRNIAGDDIICALEGVI